MDRWHSGARIVARLAAFVFAFAALGASMSAAAADPAPTRATDIIGNQLYGKEGKEIGWLIDLVLDLEKGWVAHVVVSRGAEKLIACPWDTCPIVHAQGKLVVDVPRATLQQMPTFDRSEWPDFNQAAGANPPRYARATEMFKNKIVDKDGKRAGAVRDAMVVLGAGTVAGLVVEFDPAWNNIGSLVALPSTSVVPQGADLLAKFQSRDIRPAGAPAPAAIAEPEKPQAPPPVAGERRLSALTGTEVTGPDGKSLGKIADVLIAPGSRELTHFVLTGQNAAVACTLKDVDIALKPNALTLMGPGTCQPQAAMEGAASLAKLVGSPIYEPGGTEVGRVMEVVVDLQKKRAHFAVAKFSENWVGAGFLVAVPLRLGPSKASGHAMTFDINELQRSYFFRDNQWPDFQDPAVYAEVDRRVK